MTVLCRSCQHPLAPDVKFCPECGARVVREAPAADPLLEALRTALAPAFEIVRPIGRGGMGAVYLARERALERLVAIKVLPPERARSEKDRQRFRREAQTAARLTHPNIVPLHSFGEAGDLLYFIMGYVDGEPLSQRLRREGKLPVRDARATLSDLASALDYAHRRGVVHRDVKPENVILDAETGAPMLTDFGIARAAESGATLTETGHLVGTPYYMSPEQVSGSAEIGGASDVYSLGVVAYAMLSGRLPFEGATPRDVLMQHLTAEPPPLGRIAPETPPDLVATVHRCLAKKPGDRPRAVDLRETLATTTPEGALPERLEAVESKGFMLLAGLTLAFYAALFGVAMRRELGPLAMMVVRLAVALPVLFTGAVLAAKMLEARPGGSSWREIVTVAFRPPANWGWWYPRRFRRPGDVWDRLPQPLKRARKILSVQAVFIYLVAVPSVLLGMPILASRGADADRWILALWLTSAFLSILPVALEALRCGRWLRARSFSGKEISRILSTPTSRRSFWTDPRFARLVAVDAGSDNATPADLLERVVGSARGLPALLRDAGRDATAAARAVMARIDRLDTESRRDAADVDPDEAARIASRLETLEREASDDPERRAMRRLLTDQLALLRRLEARRAAEKDARERLRAVLRTLADELEAAATPRGPDPARRLRELCRAAEREEQAMDETAKLEAT